MLPSSPNRKRYDDTEQTLVETLLIFNSFLLLFRNLLFFLQLTTAWSSANYVTKHLFLEEKLICCHKAVICILFCLFTNAIAVGTELSGSVVQDGQHFYGTEKSNSRNFSRTQFKTRGEISYSKNFKFKLDHTTLFSKVEFDQMNYLEASGDRFGVLYTNEYVDVFVGSFTHTFDGPDLNSPFDVINAKDFKQPFQPVALGSAGLHLNGSINALTTQLFYFPKQTRTRLPSLNSVWWPRSQKLPLTNSAGTFNIADGMTYKLKSENDLNNPFDNAYGAQFKYAFDDLDVYLIYFKGANQIPLIYPEFNIDVTSITPLVGTIQSPIELNYTWYASTHAGAGASYVIGDWIIKAFYKQQSDKLAFEKKSTSATSVIESSLSLGRFSLRYFLQNNRTWKPDGVSELQTLLGFFDRSTSLGFFLDAEKWGLFSGALIYNELKGGLLSSLNYEYVWTDQFKTKITVNSLTPSDDIVGKAYDNTDNVVVSLNYDFGIF